MIMEKIPTYNPYIFCAVIVVNDDQSINIRLLILKKILIKSDRFSNAKFISMPHRKLASA